MSDNPALQLLGEPDAEACEGDACLLPVVAGADEVEEQA
jgi:hypothetical protein